MPLFKVTFFLEEEPTILFPLLLPLQFKWQQDHSILWSNEKTEFRIVPFARKGREKMGYRVHFRGHPDSFQYVFDQTIARFNPLISGIEWSYTPTDHTQSELIKMAEKGMYKRCSMIGLYEHKGIGIVLMPTSEIHLQVRNRFISAGSAAKFMMEMEKTAAVFLPKPIDLFSFDEGIVV